MVLYLARVESDPTLIKGPVLVIAEIFVPVGNDMRAFWVGFFENIVDCLLWSMTCNN